MSRQTCGRSGHVVEDRKRDTHPPNAGRPSRKQVAQLHRRQAPSGEPIKLQIGNSLETSGSGSYLASLYTTPPFMTKLTCSSAKISCNGLPGTAMRSAK